MLSRIATQADQTHTDQTMSTATREDIIATLGPIDELVMADIIGMGATAEELAEASAWLANDEALMNTATAGAGTRFPIG